VSGQAAGARPVGGGGGGGRRAVGWAGCQSCSLLSVLLVAAAVLLRIEAGPAGREALSSPLICGSARSGRAASGLPARLLVREAMPAMPALGARVAAFMAAKHHLGCWRALGAWLLQLYYAHAQCRM
jgi:hypothetical protein